jgi:mRNA interferase HigB
MHVITRKRLTEFAKVHPETEGALSVWYKTVNARRYKTRNDVRADFASADFVGGHTVVFNFAKQYRLVCDVRFDMGHVYIRHVVTHEDYERLMKRGRL